MTRRIALAVAAAALAAVPATHASSATWAEVRELAARAAGDDAALAELRRVDQVDGVRVDLRAALAGASGEALERRLHALAEGGERAAPAPGAARAEAASVLQGRQFRETPAPRPFRRFLSWLGDRIRPPVEWLAERTPGGSDALFTIAGILVTLGAAWVAARLGRRRGGGVAERATRARGESALDPRALERLADEAEKRGELEGALRLRFRAGLVRLARVEAIPAAETLTSRQLMRLLRSDDFGRLARDLDEVLYGGRPASRADLDAARVGWPRVLAGVTPP